jgi:hypothetical protein
MTPVPVLWSSATAEAAMRVFPLVFLAACILPEGGDDGDKDAAADVDSDGDGLMDEEEAGFGSDPQKADTDDDMLGDADEYDLGTDPNMADSDEDTYYDGWEMAEGTDPLTPDSRIYEGYWPYNPNKDALEVGDITATARASSTLPRFAYADQYNEAVDSFDYSGQGKWTVVDTSALWCYYCQEVAKMVEGKRSYFDDYASMYSWVDGLAPLIEDGSVQWITVITQDNSGDTVSHREATTWYDAFPNDKIPVLADETKEFENWVAPKGFPTLMLFDENMNMIVFDRDDYTLVFDAVMEEYGE